MFEERPHLPAFALATPRLRRASKASDGQATARSRLPRCRSCIMWDDDGNMKVEITDDVREFIKTLEKSTIAKVVRLVGLLEKFGNCLEYPHSRKLLDKIFELRIRGKQEARVLYSFFDKDTAIILHAYVKKSDKTPRKEVELALYKYNAYAILKK